MIIMIISFARAGCFFGSRGRKTVICRVDFFFCCLLVEKGFSREDGLECGSQIFAFKGGLMVSNNTVDLKRLEGFPPFMVWFGRTNKDRSRQRNRSGEGNPA